MLAVASSVLEYGIVSCCSCKMYLNEVQYMSDEIGGMREEVNMLRPAVPGPMLIVINDTVIGLR